MLKRNGAFVIQDLSTCSLPLFHLFEKKKKVLLLNDVGYLFFILSLTFVTDCILNKNCIYMCVKTMGVVIEGYRKLVVKHCTNMAF